MANEWWVALFAGVCLAILCLIIVRLSLLLRIRNQTLAIIHQNIEKEVAERIHAEETKQNFEKVLLQGQKLQAIGTLAGGIAHDFNNILYAIIGYVEMAREDVEQNSLIYNNLGKVLDASHRGQELIARILTFSRRQHHEFKPLCLEETIKGVLSLLKPTIPASVTLDFRTLSSDCLTLGNQTQLHQILVNLINNAVDAMDGEGIIAIRLDRVRAGDEALKQFPKITHSPYCKIEIQDSGHGMEQITLERIFEPFFTTKEVGKGTGLGLATVHAIVKEHQGEITVSSQLGHGTLFTVLLPEYHPSHPSKETPYGQNSTG